MKIEINHLKITSIVQSSFNPRKSFDENAINELAQSIAEVGIIQPVVVRKKGAKYEIVCGERRFRAAAVAKLITIPCIVRELTDKEAFEFAITENLQRSDIHPLDESHAINLLKSNGYSFTEIATRLGKSEIFVRDRMRLAELTQEFQVAFYSQKVLLSQALLIAKLPIEPQQRLFESTYKDWANSDFDPKHIKNFKDLLKRAMSDLNKAVWNLDDADLIPSAGACSSCAFNTQCQSLFPTEDAEMRCLQPSCFDLKEATFQSNLIERLTSDTSIFVYYSEYQKTDQIRAAKAAGVEDHRFLMSYTDCQILTPPDMPVEPTKPVLSLSADESLHDQENEAYLEAVKEYDEEYADYNAEIEEYQQELQEYNELVSSPETLLVLSLANNFYGQMVSVKLKPKKAGSKAVFDVSTPKGQKAFKKSETERLNAKEKRALELDVVKRQKALVEASEFKLVGSKKLALPELKCLLWLLYECLDYTVKRELMKDLGLDQNDYYGDKVFSKLIETHSDQLLGFIARKAIMSKFGTAMEPSNAQRCVQLLLEHNLPKDVISLIDEEINAKRVIRQERLNIKIQALG